MRFGSRHSKTARTLAKTFDSVPIPANLHRLCDELVDDSLSEVSALSDQARESVALRNIQPPDS